MTDGGYPFYDGMPPHVATDTSVQAAEAIEPSAAALRALILHAIREAGDAGMTCDEVEAAFSMRHQTASARIRELVLGEEAADSGRRRKTRSDRNAIVWVTADRAPQDPTPVAPPLSEIAVSLPGDPALQKRWAALAVKVRLLGDIAAGPVDLTKEGVREFGARGVAVTDEFIALERDTESYITRGVRRPVP